MSSHDSSDERGRTTANLPKTQDAADRRPSHDEGFVGENIIDLRPYLLREMIDTVAPEESRTREASAATARSAFEAARECLLEALGADSGLALSEPFSDVVERRQGEWLLVFDLDDNRKV